MLYATNIFPGDGSTRKFEITFVGGYLNKSHVKVYVEDAVTKLRSPIDMGTVTWLGPYTIQLPTATPTGSNTVVARETPMIPIVDFQGSSRITEANLDVAHRQGLFVATESLDSTNSQVVAELKEAILNSATWAEVAGLVVTTGSGNVGHIGSGARAVASTVRDKLRSWVLAYEYGALGSVADETANLQAALNAAAGSTLELSASATYNYTFLTIPQNTRVVSNGCKFNRISASTSHGIVIEAGVSIDRLYITTPGGTGGDKAVAIRGSNVKIGYLSVIAHAQGNQSVPNWAVEVESSPVGTNLSHIHIDDFFCQNFSTAYFAKKTSMCSIKNAIVEYYRTAFYLRDCARSTFENITCRYLGAASNGSAGENGLLIESSLSSGSTNQLSFKNWYVSDSGEHAYRLGGGLAIKDIWFENCTATRSGSSILGGNLTSGEWHGGCGFKVLGGNVTVDQFHENIHFDNCGVIDVNMTVGTYPAGHGVNNFTPFLIVMAKNVHLSNCWTKAVGQTYVARSAMLFTAVDGLFLDNCNFRDAELIALNPYQEAIFPGYPGSGQPIKNLVVSGGLYECTTASVGSGVPFYMQQATDYVNENWTIKGAVFKGGAVAVRIETPALGSYTNLNFDFTYIGSNVDDATYSTPAIAGGGVIGAMCYVVAPWRNAAYTSSLANGSLWQATIFRKRVDNVWKDVGYVDVISCTSVSAPIITAANKLSVGTSNRNGTLQVSGGYAGFSRGATNWTPIADVSILSSITTPSTATEALTLHSDRTDRYARISSYRGAGSELIGMNFGTSGLSAPVDRLKINPYGSVNFVPMAIPSGTAVAGDVYYDLTSNKLRCYNGTIWNDLF